MLNPSTISSTSRPLIHRVETQGALASAIEGIERHPRLAIDTEFHAERRYFPELMLLQVAAPDGTAWVVDPRVLDITPLVEAIAGIPVIVHSGKQDLALLERETHAHPAHVFDVQVAAGLVGLGYPTRLGTLVAALLDRTLDKQHTLSDWSRRPLSAAQLEYAVDDVRLLFPLATKLGDLLRQDGRGDWARAASNEITATVNDPPYDVQRWIHWEIAPQMDPPTRRAMFALSTWRNTRGRDKNQPPHFMLSDGLALDLARRRPQSVEQIMANRRIPSGLVRRYGQEIVAVLVRASSDEADEPKVPTSAMRARAQAIETWATAMSDKIAIASELLMPHRIAIAVAEHGCSALEDWRAEAVGEDLEHFLAGTSGVYMTSDGTQVR